VTNKLNTSDQHIIWMVLFSQVLTCFPSIFRTAYVDCQVVRMHRFTTRRCVGPWQRRRQSYLPSSTTLHVDKRYIVRTKNLRNLSKH